MTRIVGSQKIILNGGSQVKHVKIIPTSNENNLIYLFITQTPEGEIKHSFCSS